MTEITTERLILRPFQEADLDGYHDLVGDAQAMRYIGSGITLTRENAWSQMAGMLGHWQLRGFGLWAVELAQTGEFVGRAGLFQPEGWPDLEIGWALRRRFWGNGYATEAAHAALDWAFTNLPNQHIISCIQPGNTASINLALRLGERFCHETKLQGQRVHIYKISRASWNANG